jgi:hypothetical protein
MDLVGAGALIAAAAIWLGIRGTDFRNLSPAVTLWIGCLAAVSFFATNRRKTLLSISSLFLCLGVVETGMLAYQEILKAPAKKYSYQANVASGWIAEHGSVGYAFRGPVELMASATVGDEVLYREVPYQIDAFSRRPCAFTPHPTRHALFFGGSFAFGEGLSNDQTLGCQFQEVSGGEYRSTTYAMMGWGAAQTFVQLGEDSLFTDIENPSGVAVYSFLGDHIYRTTWKIETASDFPEYPFFSLHRDGSLDGPFNVSDKRKLSVVRDLYTFLRNFSPTFRALVKPAWFQIMPRADAVITTARVLGAARRLYQKRFDGEFVVLLWPRSRLEPELEELFVDELKRQGVIVVEVPELPGDPSDAQLHPLDSHPSSQEVAWVARCLFDALTPSES